MVAENQRAVALELEARGASLALDAHALAFEAMLSAEWYGLSANDTIRAAMAEKSAALCDGKGAERVAEAVLELINSSSQLGRQAERGGGGPRPVEGVVEGAEANSQANP